MFAKVKYSEAFHSW